MHSLSDDWKIEPRSISSRRSASALVMLPLWAIAARPWKIHQKTAERRGSRSALGAGGGIAHVTDGQRPGQGFHHLLRGEIVADIAKAAGVVEALFGMVGDDAAGFLPPVLKGVQTKGDEVGGVLGAENAKNAAFFLEFVVVKRMGRRHWRVGDGIGQGQLRILKKGVGGV